MGLTSCVLLFAPSAKVLCLLVVAAVARVVYSRCADVQHASIRWGVGSGCRQVDGRRGVPSHWQRWLEPSPNVECRTELVTASDSEQLLESAEVPFGNASLCRRRQRRQRLYGTAYDWVTAGSSGFAYANLAKMAAFLATAMFVVIHLNSAQGRWNAVCLGASKLAIL
ncbi:hypothetical protein Efla_005342 [Eimeria flavescens]